MTTRFVKPGNTANVTAGGAVNSDDIDVLGGDKIGVALISGVSGDVIPYAVEGVYKLPKASAADITQFEQVLWDVSAGNCDDDQATPATGDFLCGWAAKSAGVGETEVEVHINKQGPTVN